MKKALAKNFSSFTCWHAYGLLAQSDRYVLFHPNSRRDYETARRAFQFALKYDADNIQILRDLATAQMQLREFAAACESSRILIQQKPIAQNWLSFAVTSYLVLICSAIW
ncbi:MAG: hypothetical protein P4M11_04880 [Candidatus Pacebacteria bacterium]|nr:hypothetical protein [Candidatus Paceibacterota bacterium]